jgi:hypothetical protein
MPMLKFIELELVFETRSVTRLFWLLMLSELKALFVFMLKRAQNGNINVITIVINEASSHRTAMNRITYE